MDDYHLFALWDTLGSWPERDEQMARLYLALEAEQAKRQRSWLKAQSSGEKVR